MRNTEGKINTILSRADVCRETGLSSTTLWRLVRAGAFPQPIRLSANRIGFRAATVSAWITDKEAAATEATPAPPALRTKRTTRHTRHAGRRR